MKLDNNHFIIIKTLLQEARTPLTTLAKKLDLSIPSISSRINYLKKKGIINGSLMQINPEVLGFSCCGVLQIFTSPENEKDVREFLIKKQLSYYDNDYFSKSNFGVFFAQRNTDELYRLMSQIKMNSKIWDVKPVIYNDLAKIDFGDNLVIPIDHPNHIKNTTQEVKESVKTKNIEKSNKDINLDKMDLQIARILSKDAQVPFSRIGKQIGISTNNVISRYRELRQSGVLSNSSITINLSKLGYYAMLVLFLNSSPLISALELYNRVVTWSNVIVAVKLLTPFDLMIIVPISNPKEVFALKKKVHDLKGVRKIEIELHSPYTRWPLNIFAHALDKLELNLHGNKK